MHKLEDKKEFILKYGNIETYDSMSKDLSSVQEKTYGFQFFKRLFIKLGLLFEEFFREKDF